MIDSENKDPAYFVRKHYSALTAKPPWRRIGGMSEVMIHLPREEPP